MRYLIIFDGNTHKPFFTKWFEPENNWQEGMTVIDLNNHSYTRDGKVWYDVEIDHL